MQWVVCKQQAILKTNSVACGENLDAREVEREYLPVSLHEQLTVMLSIKLSTILQSGLRQHSKATRKLWVSRSQKDLTPPNTVILPVPTILKQSNSHFRII